MKKNVRVCHLTSVHKHTDIRIFHKECKSLAEAGYNVTIIAPGTIEQTIDGVTLKSVKSFSNRFLRMLFTTYLVYRKGLEENASIYHFHDPELMPWGYLLKIKGKKVIFDVHEDVAMQIYGKYWINRYLKSIVILIYNILEKYFASNFNYLITVTETISHKLKKINNNVIVVNNYPLSYEYENETYSWHKKENSVIYMGGITEIRGAKQMLEAINLCPNVNFNLLGEFSPQLLKDEIYNETKMKNVNYKGWVDRKTMREVLKKSKAGLVTFLPLPNHVSAQPNKIFEYMSAGIPVIASNFDLWREIIEGNSCGICVNPENPTEIAQAINYLIANDKEAQKMGENGKRAVVEKYNWTIEKKKLFNVYHNQL